MIFLKRWVKKVAGTFWGKVLIGLIVTPLVIGLVIGGLMLVGFIVQWLWNATITEIFGTSPMTLWQGLFLLVLCKVLFANQYKVERGK
jgi:hypothetical protein